MTARVKHAYRFPNGMVAVFGHDGHQIPELQGRFDEVRDRVVTASDEDTRFHGDWPPASPGAADSLADVIVPGSKVMERIKTLPEPSGPVKAAVDVVVGELLNVITLTDSASMPLTTFSLSRNVAKIGDPVIDHDHAAQRRGLLILAATSLLMAGRLPKGK